MTRDTSERLQSVRVRTSLAVSLKGHAHDERCEAIEIAPGGVFLATERVRPLYQLVSMRIELPAGEPLHVLGMVSRRVEPEQARSGSTPAGIGVRFYGLRPETQKAWQEFVKRRAGEAFRARAATLASTTGLDPRFVKAALSSDVEEGLGRAKSLKESGISSAMLADALAKSKATGHIRDSAPGDAPEDSKGSVPPDAAPIFFVGEDEGSVSQQRPGAAEQHEEPPPAPADADTERITLHGIAPAEADDGDGGRDTYPSEMPEPVEDPDDGAITTVHETVARGRAATLPPPPSRDAEAAAESEAIVPAEGLAPTQPMAHVVYRLELPTLEALAGFGETALDAGGVFVRTPDIRTIGTAAVVCVVHPVSRDELHLPGEITKISNDPEGVAVVFPAVTPRTYKMFRSFLALGMPDSPELSAETSLEELAMLRPHDGGGCDEDDDDEDCPRDTAEIDMADVLPMLQEE